MKKSYIISIALGVLVVVLLAISIFFYLKSEYLEDREDYNNYNYNINDNNSNNTDNLISRDEALEIVLKNLGINKNDIYDLDNELDYKYNTQVYDIDFKYNRYEYEFYVDAKNGDILKSFKERD